jgi:MFS family permease
MFNSLRHRNYRIFLAGQTVSLIGTWVQGLATSWLVYSLTKSPFWLGLTGFATQIPTFIFSIFTGVYVDHVNKLKLLKWTQSLALIQALALAIFSYTNHINIFILLFLNFVLGTINAFDMNARQSFVVHMVPDRADLPNAIALNSTIANGTRLIGPMMAGIAIAYFGVTVCFVINAISFLAVLAALFSIKVTEPKEKKLEISKIIDHLKVGWNATFKHDSIRSLILFLTTSSFFGMPYINLFPAMAHFVGHDNSKSLGIITTASGVGSLLSAIYLAKRKSPPDLAFVIGTGGLIMGLFISLCLIFNNFYWLLICVAIAGFGLMFQLSATNTMVQTLVEDDKRSRVLSFLLLAMMGISPFGSLVIGFLSEKVGIKNTLLVNGMITTFFAILFLKKAPQINIELLEHIQRRKKS